MRRRGPFIIYGLIDPRDLCLRYVGKSSSGMRRPRAHFAPSRLKENTHKDHWIAAVLRDGLIPEIAVLEECVEDALVEAEQFYIAYFRSLGCKLTNATDGGEGAPGVRPSEATRKKMSATRKGRPKSQGHREAIALALKGHQVAETTRVKIGSFHTGNKYCIGRTLSVESREKMSESLAGRNKGVPLPRTTREKMSEAAHHRRRRPDGTFVGKDGVDRAMATPTYSDGEIVKVELTYENGIVRTLTGEAAIKWGKLVAAQGTFCAFHSGAPKAGLMPWVERKT